MTDNVIILDLGTFCDHNIMSHVIADVTRQPRIKNITYITDESNSLVTKRPGLDIMTYKAPDFLWTIGPDLADPKANVSMWAMKNPMRAMTLSSFMADISDMLANVITLKKENLKRIIVSYPALGIVLKSTYHDSKMFDKISIIHYAPTYPNSTVPWIFDSCLKDSTWRMFRTSEEFNLLSHDAYASALASYNSLSKSHVDSFLKKVQHVACWDPLLIDRDILEKNDITVVKCRPLISSRVESRGHVPKWLSQKFIYLSFGSYAQNSKMRHVASTLVPVLEQWAESASALIVLAFKEPLKKTFGKRVVTCGDFVDYSIVASRASLVVFTGSLCMQTHCVANSTPMLFVPFIAEQFFWAKNYASLTSLPYIDPNDFRTMPKTRDDIDRFVSVKSLRQNALRQNKTPDLPTVGQVTCL